MEDELETKQAFLMLYGVVRDGVADGSIDPAKANQALSIGSNAIVGRSGTGEAWKPFREGISAELLALAAAGNYGSQSQIVAALSAIIDGMRLQSLTDHNFDVAGVVPAKQANYITDYARFMASAAFGDRFRKLDPEKLTRWLQFIMQMIAVFTAL